MPLTANLSDAFRTFYMQSFTVQYQLMGSQLARFLMGPSNINAENVKFDILSKIDATTKARGEKIQENNPKHGHVLAELKTHYALSGIDRQDMARMDKPDIMKKYAMQGAMAVGRAEDNVIVNDAFKPAFLDSESIKIGSTTSTTGLTLEKAVAAVQELSKNDVGYGQITAIIGPEQYSNLMSLPEFANADLSDQKVWGAMTPEKPRVWRGATWVCYNNMPVVGTNVRQCIVFDKAALGYANSDGIWYEADYIIEEDSFKVLHGIDAAAITIQGAGVSVIHCKEKASTEYAAL